MNDAMVSTTTTTTVIASKSKTIKPPGSNTSRVSVACDRCRKKKIRCFYDDEDEANGDGENGFLLNGPEKKCANCKAVGLECIFTDKLARKAFPRGYTESLEERVRVLEYENRKLQKMLTFRKEGTSSDDKVIEKTDGTVNRNKSGNNFSNKLIINNMDVDVDGLNNEMVDSKLHAGQKSDDNTHGDDNGKLITQLIHYPQSQLNLENISKLDDLHTHDENCNCGMHHSVINRPVSIAGSVDVDRGELSDDDSIYSIDSFNSPYDEDDDFSLPNRRDLLLRSTKKNKKLGINNNENRFVHNPNSFEQVNAPGAVAAISLQNKLRTKNFLNLANLIAASIPRSTEETLFIPALLARIIKTHGFDSRAPYLTARTIALLKQAYNEENRYNLYSVTFQGVDFNNMNKQDSKAFFTNLNLPNNLNLDICIQIFFNTWNTTLPILNKEIFMSNYKKFIKSRDLNFKDGDLVGFEKFGELLVIIVCLVMISNEMNNVISKNPTGEDVKITNNSEILQFYDHLIKQLIQSNMTSRCSISSLQIIVIELLYCLTTDDLTTSYELRGKMVTMCQQLRLHRCPAAVLGSNGSNVSKLQQGERRILFWCIYTLDSFSAFILGVPRLFKDYEIECALPSSSSNDSDTNLITFNNNIQLSLVGKVCDSALSIMRYSKILGEIVDSIFRRSDGLKQTNVTESKCLLMEDMLENWRRNLASSVSFDLHDSNIDALSETQLTLYYLYYQAKALIYMPLLATESTNSLTLNKGSPAFINIQKATTSILSIFKVLNSSKHEYYYLPIPINKSRQMVRFSLLAAKNALEYTRGGSLFQEAKNLLTFIIGELKIENKVGLIGCLSDNCINCLEHAIEAILSQPKVNNGNGDNGKAMKVKREVVAGSSLKIVSNQINTDIKGARNGIKNGETKNMNEGMNKDVALNDIFSEPKRGESIKIEAGQGECEGGNGRGSGSGNRNGGSSKEDEMFKFMCEDVKEMEEKSLNMILRNEDEGLDDSRGFDTRARDSRIQQVKKEAEIKLQFEQQLKAEEEDRKQREKMKQQAHANYQAQLQAHLQYQNEKQVETQMKDSAQGQTNVNVNVNVNVNNDVDGNADGNANEQAQLEHLQHVMYEGFGTEGGGKGHSIGTIGNANNNSNFSIDINPGRNAVRSANDHHITITGEVDGVQFGQHVLAGVLQGQTSLDRSLGVNGEEDQHGFNHTHFFNGLMMNEGMHGSNSFNDLLMMNMNNDFGVDASMGLPLLDFEFDNNSRGRGSHKRPRIDEGSSIPMRGNVDLGLDLDLDLDMDMDMEMEMDAEGGGESGRG